MFNKKLLTAAVTTALMASAGLAQAQEDDDRDGASSGGFEISGNIALVSDYRFRGISQSDRDPAVQGGFDIEFGPGFYAGTWGSSVNFDNDVDYDGSLELDYYAGWSGAIGDTDFGVDVGYAYYDYPGDTGEDGDYGEVYVAGSWKDISLAVNYSDDYYAGTGKFIYYAADYGFSLFDDMISVGLHVGYNDFDKAGEFLSNDQDSYTDWSVTLGYSWAGVDFSVAYVDTDLDEEDVFDTQWADGTAVFTISKSM